MEAIPSYSETKQKIIQKCKVIKQRQKQEQARKTIIADIIQEYIEDNILTLINNDIKEYDCINSKLHYYDDIIDNTVYNALINDIRLQEYSVDYNKLSLLLINNQLICEGFKQAITRICNKVKNEKGYNKLSYNFFFDGIQIYFIENN